MLKDVKTDIWGGDSIPHMNIHFWKAYHIVEKAYHMSFMGYGDAYHMNVLRYMPHDAYKML